MQLEQTKKMINRLQFFHSYLKSKGIYSLAGKSILRLIIIVIILGAVLYLAQTYITDFNDNLKAFLLKWDWKFVISLFFISAYAQPRDPGEVLAKILAGISEVENQFKLQMPSPSKPLTRVIGESGLS